MLSWMSVLVLPAFPILQRPLRPTRSSGRTTTTKPEEPNLALRTGPVQPYLPVLDRVTSKSTATQRCRGVLCMMGGYQSHRRSSQL